MRLIVPCLFAVYADGGICLDILQNQWSPIYDVSAILTSIQVGFAVRISLPKLPAVTPCATELRRCYYDGRQWLLATIR